MFLDSIPLRTYPPIVIVHSGLFPFGILEGGITGLYSVLREWVGPSGTLLMPTFNFKKRECWHRQATPSETGVLTEYFRNQEKVIRTIHPIHSVAISGPLAEYFCSDIERSSFGRRSIFSKLFELKANNISLGTEFEGGATYLHYFEELAQVPYREYIDLKTKVYDYNGIEVLDDFKYFARKYNNGQEWENNWSIVFDDLKSNNLLSVAKIGPAKVMHSNIHDVGIFFLNKLLKNPLYCTNIKIMPK